MRVLKQSTARTIAVFLADSSDHITGKTGATLTVTASKNGASFASISPTVTELANGWYSVALTTSHTDTLGDLAIHATASGADPIDTLSQVVAYNPADSVRLGLTALPNAAAEASGGLITRGSGTGQMLVLSGLCSASVAVDGVGAASIASGAYAAIADAVIDYALTNGAAGGLGEALTLLLARLTSTRAGYLDNLSAGAVATASSLTTVGGNVTTILGQTGTTGVVVASGSKSGYSLTQSFPTNFSSLAITGGGAVTAGTVSDKTGYSLATTPPTAAQIATQVWSDSVPGGYTSGQAGNVLGNVATGTPPTAAAIADAVWDEARSGHTTGGTYGYLVDAQLSTLATASALSAVDANVSAILDDTGTSGVVVASGSKSGYSLATPPPTASAIATAVLNTQMTESYAADGAAPTLTQSVLMTQQHLCDASISSTTKTIKKLDGSTAAATFTLDSATSPTSITRAS